jgi:membrane-associated phospholipid phosphatase
MQTNESRVERILSRGLWPFANRMHPLRFLVVVRVLGIAVATLVLLLARARADEAGQVSQAIPQGGTPGAPGSLIELPPSLMLVAPRDGSKALATAARPTHRLEWDPRWRRFRVVEYVTTAATSIAAIGVFYFVKPSTEPHWVGPILFDAAVRDVLRLHTRSGLEAAATASYVTAVIPPAQALVDSLVLPAIDRNFDLVWQLGMMDAQSFAFSALVTTSLYDTVGRARPSYLDCKSGKSVDPLCNTGEFASFPSGHTSAAMTGAGLICAHHGALPLYGGRAWDVAACIEGLTVATGVGVLRMMADRHYASDVLTGGAIGFFSGYALPRLLHYWKRPLGEVVSRDDLKMAVVPGGGTTPIGAQMVGIF